MYKSAVYRAGTPPAQQRTWVEDKHQTLGCQTISRFTVSPQLSPLEQVFHLAQTVGEWRQFELDVRTQYLHVDFAAR